WSDFALRTLRFDDIEGTPLYAASVRRAISPSRISHAHRLLERRALPSGRVVWQIFDYLREKVNSPFLEPLGYVGSGTEYVFSLSNGLFAFVTPNPNDAFVTETPVPLDTLEYSLPARTPVACWGCHASGLIAA